MSSDIAPTPTPTAQPPRVLLRADDAPTLAYANAIVTGVELLTRATEAGTAFPAYARAHFLPLFAAAVADATDEETHIVPDTVRVIHDLLTDIVRKGDPGAFNTVFMTLWTYTRTALPPPADNDDEDPDGAPVGVVGQKRAAR